MNLEEIKDYLKIEKKASFNKEILEDLKKIKEDAIAANNEKLANEIWCLERISNIQNSYINAFSQLKDKQYLDAWRTFDQIDLNLCHLRPHFDFNFNLYNLEFIEGYIEKFQKLFPYHHFFSREMVIKKVTCTICGNVNTIRHHCEHKAGELYMGEMCCRKVEDVDFLGVSLVTNPQDKYAVISMQGKEYDYFALDYLCEILETPYDRWNLETDRKLKPEFEKAQRNKPCPCGSGKKYKNCCKGADSELMINNKITFLDKAVRSLPYTLVGTWKENGN